MMIRNRKETTRRLLITKLASAVFSQGGGKPFGNEFYGEIHAIDGAICLPGYWAWFHRIQPLERVLHRFLLYASTLR